MGLTKRESEIVWWLTMGKSDSDIADICEVSRRTVQKHCEHICIAKSGSTDGPLLSYTPYSKCAESVYVLSRIVFSRFET